METAKTAVLEKKYSPKLGKIFEKYLQQRLFLVQLHDRSSNPYQN